MTGRALLLALLAALALSAAPAQAAFLETGGFQGNTEALTIGPDGNLWVSEPGNDSIVRMTRGGSVLHRYAVAGDAHDITTGPGGRVWAAVQTPSSGKLVWFDALAGSPTAHDEDTTSISACAPVAIAAGNNGKVYFSLPKVGACPDDALLGHMNDDGTGAPTAVAGRGQAFDLEVSAGKLFVPDYNGNVVRRLALNNALTVESTVTVPGGGNPQGIAADGAGGIWTTLFNAGTVARFPATQNGGNATVLTPSGGTLTSPFGIAAAGDGGMYVAGFNSTNVVRIDRATNAFTFFPADPSAYPWRIVAGLEEDLWVTDRGGARLLRLVPGGPRIGALSLAADSPTSAILDIEVNPRGGATQLVVDYGTTSAYGTTTAPISIPAGVGFVAQRVTLSGLSPMTDYHARARVTNADGEASTQDMAFNTPPEPGLPVVTPPPPPVVLPRATALGARIVHRARTGRRFTRITVLRVDRLTGGERIVVTCTGRGCPFRRRTVVAPRTGRVNLAPRFRGRRLRRGARVRVLVTKPGFLGRSRSLTIRKRRSPRVRNTCLAVGATTPAACS